MEIEINESNVYNLLELLSKILDKRTSLYKEIESITNKYNKEEYTKICKDFLDKE